ncbi:MAG: ABC transporter permease [Paracoccaceae bacterium]
MSAAGAFLRAAPALTIAAMLGPVLAGMAGVAAPAFGWFPALGGDEFGLAQFRALSRLPNFTQAAWLSFSTGMAATLISLAIVALIMAGWQGTCAFRVIERALSPLLAAPHAAAAFGLAFLIAPSGWVARAFSPWATGWEQAPDLLIVNDPNGLALIAGLVAKEAPFLFLMALAALDQVQAEQSRMVAATLGHGRVSGWIKTVFPRVYPQIRLPVYAVLAFSMSAVDVALILGPTTPAPLSVLVLQWMNDPDVALRFRGAAAAMAQLGLVVAALGLWRVGELLIAVLGRRWVAGGGRGMCEPALRGLGLFVAVASAAAVGAGLLGLGLWSFAGYWSFPDFTPDALSLRTWARSLPTLAAPAAATALIGLAAMAAAMVLTLACLETETRRGRRPSRAVWLLYLPLIAPQIAFLPGLQMLALAAGLNGGTGAVMLGHLVFVLPYVFLSLADPWRALDPRFALGAGALGAGPGRVFLLVRLPLLLPPILAAAAVGFAVSVGQYLPTLLLGGGRVGTLTTEAVALAAGGDRRLIGVYALALTAAAFAPFAIALTAPRALWRNRRGMRT